MTFFLNAAFHTLHLPPSRLSFSSFPSSSPSPASSTRAVIVLFNAHSACVGDTTLSACDVEFSKPCEKVVMGTECTSHEPTVEERAMAGIPERYVMVFLCALCTCINYADRVNMSVAIISMATVYGLTLRQQSMILSAFFLGYIPMQIGGAVLCRRFGAKMVLTYGAFLWSTFTVLTPFAGDMGFAALVTCRLLMGLAEGVAFPSLFHFLSSWTLPHERGRAVAVLHTGVHIGTCLALIVSPYIIHLLNWRYIFYIFGSSGMGWIVVWQLLAYDKDSAANAGCNDALTGVVVTENETNGAQQSDIELLSIVKEEPSSSVSSVADGPPLKTEKDPHIARRPSSSSSSSSSDTCTAPSPPKSILSRNELRIIYRLLSDRRTLGVCLSQSIFAMIHFVMLSWLPSYFKHVFKLEAGEMSFTFVPYAAMAIGANTLGYISDRLIKRGYDITAIRKNVSLIASFGAATSLVLFSRLSTVTGSIVAAALSMGLMAGHTGGFFSTYLDLTSPECSGLFKAVSNTMSSGAGFLAVPLSTLMLELLGGSWRWMFASLSVLHVLVGVVFYRTYAAGVVATH